MGMAVGGPDGAPQHDINVTPLIDVVLVLLIIFMVLTPMLQKAHQVALPAPADPTDVTTNVKSPSTQLILSVDKDKAIFLNQDPVTLADLPAKVKEILGSRTDKIVFFRCDPSIQYAYAVNLMDLCRGAGVTKIGIITEELKKETEGGVDDLGAAPVDGAGSPPV